MRFTYKPEGATKARSWPFEPLKLMSPEAEAVERLTGMPFNKWVEQVQEGSVTAIHGLLWVLLRRDNPTLKYDAVQFSMGEVDFVLDAEERAAVRKALAAVVAGGGQLDEDQQGLLEQIDAQEAEELAELRVDDAAALLAEEDVDADPPAEEPAAALAEG